MNILVKPALVQSLGCGEQSLLPTGSNPQGRKLNFCYLHFLIFLQHSMSEKLNIPGSVSEIFN